jgi:hypothetical protein
MGVMHGDNKILSLKECHFYLPEFANRSRVFVLLYMQAHSPIASSAETQSTEAN